MDTELVVMPWWQKLPPGVFRDGPWLSPAQVAMLQSILKPEFRVFEHGSGGSTLWFAKQVSEVEAVETNDAWREAVIAEAERRGLANVRVLDAWPAFKGMDRRLRYDLVFVDGPWRERGAAIIDAFELIVKPGGWVVIDNYDDRTEKEWQAIRGRGEETLIGSDAPEVPWAKTAYYHVFEAQYPND